MALHFLVLIDPNTNALSRFLENTRRHSNRVKLLHNHTGEPGVEGVVLLEAPSKTAAELFTKDLENKTGTTTQLLTLSAFPSAGGKWM